MTSGPPPMPNAVPGSPAPAPGAELRAAAAFEKVLAALEDSSAGLVRSAELVEDDALASALIEISDKRLDARTRLVTVAAESSLQVREQPAGTVRGALRRGWMRLQASVSGDEQVMETAIGEEDSLAAACHQALEHDLPKELADLVRATRDEVVKGRDLLQSWRETAAGL